MDNVIAFLFIILIIFIASTIGGFILWLIWPVAIPAIFPGLVESGVIAGKIGLWPAICFAWLFSILIKTSQYNSSKDK